MSTTPNKPIRSPSYPSMSLRDAVDAVGKIERQYRSSPVDRAIAAKLIGYSSASGPANKALAALASYGLLARAGKGETRVTERARDLLYAESEGERKAKLREAALEPALFRDICERFDGIPVPPEEGVITYLNRQGFNPSAVRPAARAFLETMEYLEEIGASESNGKRDRAEEKSELPERGNDAVEYGGAKVGDLIQWESQGQLQFSTPLRVRHVTSDGQWVAVEGSETGIPMSEVIVEKEAAEMHRAPLPTFPLEQSRNVDAEGEEWFRAKVGPEKQIIIHYRGTEDIGPKEIQKLIDILTAQKTALED